LSFALSGLPADGTIAAAVVYTMRDLHQSRAALDYPVGGSDAVIQALIRGITKSGKGRVLLNSPVQEIIVDETGHATGIRLKRGKKIIKAKRAVISNASIWDTIKLLPQEAISESTRQQYMSTPMTGSFVHLHIGIDATGLPKDLESHYTVINTWDKIDSPQNHVIISIPSVLDPNLAPPGCHVIHAYAAANEPYDLYENITSKEKYKEYKEERCEFLWKAIEKSIPDVRSRVKLSLSGSPITHERFNRRYKGTFGPAFRAGQEKFPYPKFPEIEGLYLCGDSRFPGIGVPAVAVSGAIAASSTVSVAEHLQMLKHLYSLSTNK
jgi:phytoene dehydrogenase-like protein